MVFSRYKITNILKIAGVLYLVALLAGYTVFVSIVSVRALSLDPGYENNTGHEQVGWCGGGEGDFRSYCRRNCTSYVAYKLATLGVSSALYANNGNGMDWDDHARAKGLTISTSAKVGAVAYWNSGGGGYGHVGWVESVNTDGTANTSNYNGLTEEFYTQNSVRPDGYIYFPNVGSNVVSGLSQNVSATRNADGRIEIFAVGTDGNIYSKPQVIPGGAWRDGWNFIPAKAKSITATTSADGRIELFYVGQDNAVWHRWQTTKNGIFNSPEERLPANL